LSATSSWRRDGRLARFIALYWGKHYSGSSDYLGAKYAGAGTIVPPIMSIMLAKPDGLTLGLVNPAIYIDQLLPPRSKVRLA
jgi:hypothetical protein